jgi:hypothetical protein
MNSPEPRRTEFLKRFIGDTASLLSGGLSIPSTVLSLYLDNKYAKASFGVLVVAGFLIASGESSSQSFQLRANLDGFVRP